MSKDRVVSVALVLAGAGLMGACGSTSAPPQPAAVPTQRAVLNDGYSLLYDHISSLSKIDLIFLVKSESEPVNDLTTEVTGYADTLMKTLERVAEDYPAVQIDLDPVAEIEKRTRAAVTKDRVLSFAPVVGLTGESFDRRVLQSLEGVLNQLRFMAQAIAEEEPEPSLAKIWAQAHTRFEELYTRVLTMLQDKYYINTGERKVTR